MTLKPKFVGKPFQYLPDETHLRPGRSLTLAVISPASGVSFSTSSKAPQNDLFWPRKVFLADEREQTLLVWTDGIWGTWISWLMNERWIVNHASRLPSESMTHILKPPSTTLVRTQGLTYFSSRVWGSVPSRQRTAAAVHSRSRACVPGWEPTRSGLWCSAWPCSSSWAFRWRWDPLDLKQEGWRRDESGKN